MDEKEKEAFFKAAAKQHSEVRSRVEAMQCNTSMQQNKALIERRKLESLGRWMINKCLGFS